MIKLSNRLKKIATLCSGYNRIADIGCDHGKVLGYIVENYKPEFLIASDISRPSVLKAKQLLSQLNFHNFDVRVGNGLNTLNNEDRIDLAIVAGMGGIEIIEILKNNIIKMPDLILQPQNNVIKLREFLCKSNYKIVFDEVVLDNKKFYTILKVVCGMQNLSQMQIKYGINYMCLQKDYKLNLLDKLDKLNYRLPNLINIENIEKTNKEMAELRHILTKGNQIKE